MSTPVIPINLLTHQAFAGLCIFRKGLPQNPEAAVLDDWLKEHGIDVQRLAYRFVKPDGDKQHLNARAWYIWLLYDPRVGWLNEHHRHLLHQMAGWLPPCPP